MEIIEQIKSTEPIILAGYIFLLAGIILIIFNLRAILRAKSSLTWDKTKGKILSSELVVHKGTGDSSSRTFKPKVVYQYSIRDKIYKSKRVYFGSNIMSSFKKSKSEKIVTRYSKDKEVDVYYNRMNEKLSVLEPGVKSEIITGFLIGLIFMIIGYILTYYPDLIRNLSSN